MLLQSNPQAIAVAYDLERLKREAPPTAGSGRGRARRAADPGRRLPADPAGDPPAHRPVPDHPRPAGRTRRGQAPADRAVPGCLGPLQQPAGPRLLQRPGVPGRPLRLREGPLVAPQPVWNPLGPSPARRRDPGPALTAPARPPSGSASAGSTRTSPWRSSACCPSTGPSSKAAILSEGLLAYESLLRITEDVQAEKLASWLLSFRQDGEMYSLLADAAGRVGRRDVESSLNDEARRLLD